MQDEDPMNQFEEPVDVEVVGPDEEGFTPAVADDVLPDTLHIMPVPNRPFFPGQVQPVAINPQEWGETLKAGNPTISSGLNF